MVGERKSVSELTAICSLLMHKNYIISQLSQQGIINMNKNGNSANLFSYVCNGKKIKELFASTLNGIPISGTCVSSMIIVLNTKFARSLAAHANRKTR